ncbi:MAG: hypothetical protein NXI31_04510 [bacterium]|nr:hypothetical protein [bacterium]
MIKPLFVVPVLLTTALTAGLTAQSYLEMPATANPSLELPDFGLRPFAQRSSRVQMFFDASEVGASTFTATEVAFRWDGPLPRVGAPGPFNIQRLRISIGVTTVATPAARFADNLSSSLTTVFDSTVNYFPDPGSASPHPWGGPNDSLRFPFTVNVPLTIPAGGWLVLDVQMENNNFSMFGFAHTILDGVATSGGPSDGQAVSFGQGCSIDGSTPPVTIGVEGTKAPGAAHFITGQNLGADAPLIVAFGLSNTRSLFGALPLTFPGTNCDLLVSLDATTLTFADSTGALTGLPFVVPPVAAYAGVTLHHQLVAFAPAANSLGAAFSNAQTVTLGTLAAPGRGTYVVSHGSDADATIATEVSAFGYAARLGTL